MKLWTIQNSSNRWIFLSILGLFLVTAFFPLFYLDYGVHNDYSVFLYDNQKCCLGHPESQHLFWIGRPLNALLVNIQLLFIDQIADFRWVRLASFLALLILFVAIFRQFDKESEGNAVASAFAAFCLVLLPSSLLYVYYLTHFVPGIVNLLLASVSYNFVYSSYRTAGYVSTLKLVIGYLILFLTFFIYPPTSYFFLVFTCWRVLMSKRLLGKEWQIRTAIELLMMCVLSGLYFLSLNLIATPTVILMFFKVLFPRPTGPYVLSLAENFLERFDSAKNYIHQSFQLWLLDWSDIFFVITLCVLFLFLLISIRTIIKKERNEWILGASRIVVPIFAFGIAGAPMVISSGGFTTTRNVFVGSSIISLLLLAGVFHLFRYFGSKKGGELALGLLSVVALLAANVRFTTASLNASLELKFVRGRLSMSTPESLSQGIVIEKPFLGPAATTIVGFPVTSDFTLLATNTSQINASSILRGVLKEMGLEYRNIPIRERLNPGNTRFYVAKSHVAQFTEICMSDAGFDSYHTTHSACDTPPSVVDLSQVAISSKLKDISSDSVLWAFDNSPSTFWETRFEESVTLDIDYKYPTILHAYEFYCGEHGDDSTNRMPISWKLLASSDGSTWATLDNQNDIKAWHQNEKRRFEVISQPYRYYRFIFEKTSNPGIMRIYEINLIDNHGKSIREVEKLPILLEGYRGFNIIGSQNRIYAILQSEGAFSIDRINNKSYSRSIVGTSVEEVKQAIDRYDGSSYYPQPVILVEGYRGLNIIGAQNRVYAVPPGEGTVNILFAGTSLKEVMQQIDNASVKK